MKTKQRNKMKGKASRKKIGKESQHGFFYTKLPNKYRYTILGTVFCFVFLVALGLYWQYYGLGIFRPRDSEPQQITEVIPPSNSIPKLTVGGLTPSPCPTVPTATSIDFPTDGKVHLLPQQLDIPGYAQDCINKTSFYSAGTVASGKYAGYKRIVAYTTGFGGSGSLDSWFAHFPREFERIAS